jgi:hypothetical protein
MRDLPAANPVVDRVAPEPEELRSLLDREDVVVWGGVAVVGGAHELMLLAAPR